MFKRGLFCNNNSLQNGNLTWTFYKATNTLSFKNEHKTNSGWLLEPLANHAMLVHLWKKGWKHTKPPQNCSHMCNISMIKFFGNVWTSHFGLFFLVLSIFD
jgi:hypothetical protein